MNYFKGDKIIFKSKGKDLSGTILKIEGDNYKVNNGGTGYTISKADIHSLYFKKDDPVKVIFATFDGDDEKCSGVILKRVQDEFNRPAYLVNIDGEERVIYHYQIEPCVQAFGNPLEFQRRMEKDLIIQ